MDNSERKVLSARTCYGHLGGTLGNRLFESLLMLGWLERDGGKTTVYTLTEQGKKGLESLGVDIYEHRHSGRPMKLEP